MRKHKLVPNIHTANIPSRGRLSHREVELFFHLLVTDGTTTTGVLS